jgi:hypothetical protein
MSAYQQWKQAARQMVADLPDDEDVVIVVLRHDIGRDLRDGIAELRGKNLARRCKMLQVSAPSDCIKLSGLNCKVVIDHSVTQHVSSETIATLSRIVSGIEAARAR